MTDIIEAPENKALLRLMCEQHPGISPYLLENALRFYLAGCLDPSVNRKKRGRKPKPVEQPTEYKGAVTINNAS